MWNLKYIHTLSAIDVLTFKERFCWKMFWIRISVSLGLIRHAILMYPCNQQHSYSIYFRSKLLLLVFCLALQSCTGPVQGQNRGFSVYSFSHGKPCFHYWGTLSSLQGPCFHYRDFPVRKTILGKPCFHYREWVCSVLIIKKPPL